MPDGGNGWRGVDGALLGDTIGELARVGTAPLGLRTGVVFVAGGLGRTNGQRETCAPSGGSVMESPSRVACFPSSY